MSIAIDIRNISKKFKYGNKEFYALRKISFKIDKGEIFGLLGPNGAGKTTLINILTMILTPDEGTAKIFGLDIKKDRYKILEAINSLSTEVSFHHLLKVKHILEFYAKLYENSYLERKKIIQNLTEKFEIKDIMEKRFLKLSSGQKMRVALAKLLINSPKLLLLDEPTLGLDPDIAVKTRKLIKEINKNENVTILLTSHYMNEVEELCERIAYIDLGKITDIGKIKKLKEKKFTKTEVIAKVVKIKNKGFLEMNGFDVKGNKIMKTIENNKDPSEILKLLVRNGLDVIEFQTKKPTLEEYFLKMTRDKHEN